MSLGLKEVLTEVSTSNISVRDNRTEYEADVQGDLGKMTINAEKFIEGSVNKDILLAFKKAQKTTWLPTSTYANGDYVLSNGIVYKSTADDNSNYDPQAANFLFGLK